MAGNAIQGVLFGLLNPEETVYFKQISTGVFSWVYSDLEEKKVIGSRALVSSGKILSSVHHADENSLISKGVDTYCM